MFRLNIFAGLRVDVASAENSQEISNIFASKRAHLEFPGAYGVVPTKERLD